jgi:hypothetical protein
MCASIFALGANVSAQYCEGGPSSANDSNVEVVDLTGEFATAINYVGCPGVIGSEDQTVLFADLLQDSTYNVSVTFGTCGGNYGGAGEIWIDFNMNDIFEAGESVGSSSGTPGTAPWSAPIMYSFTIPAGFTGTTRMRVMQQESGSLPLDPCGAFNWGSSTDFTINVLESAQITDVQDILCAGESTGAMTATFNVGVMPIVYAWDNGDATQTITDLAAGTYCVTMTDANGATATVCDSIVDNATPFNGYISASDVSLCNEEQGMMMIDSISGGISIPPVCGISAYDCDGDLDSIEVGTNDILVGGFTYPSPLGNYYWGARHQMVYQASELLAAGVQPGNLSGLAFFIDDLGTADVNLIGWNIKVGCTLDSMATAFDDVSPVEVYPQTDVTITVGWNWYSFANSFYWNGTDNVIVETCFNNAGYTNNPNMACEITTLATTVYYRGDNAAVCGNSAVSGTSTNRPIIQFENCISTPPSFDYVYSWNTGETADTINAIPGDVYTLTITDGVGCEIVLTDSIIGSSPSLTVTSTDVLLGSDGTVDLTVTDGAAPYTYDWDNDGSGDNDDTEDLTGLDAGDYMVNVIDANGCISMLTVTVNSQLGLGDNVLSTFNVYPNPTSGIFYIEPLSIAGENVTGQILDATGRVVENITFNGTQTIEVNLSNVERGVYFINISVDGNTTITKILVN